MAKSQQKDKGNRDYFLTNPVVNKIKRRAEKYASSVTEIISQYREFTIGKDETLKTLRVYFPTPKIETEASKMQAKVWGKLIGDEELKTEAEILNILEARGVWDESKDAKIESLKNRLSRLSSDVFKHRDGDIDEATLVKLTDDYTKTESELTRLVDLKSTYTSNSLENRTADIRIKAQMWQCVKLVKKNEETGEIVEELLWKDFEALDNERDRVLLINVMNECITFWQGVPADFLEDSPEVTNGEEDTQ